MSEPLRARPAGGLTPREIDLAARLLSVLLPLTSQEQLDTLAIVCRALWDGRLQDPKWLALARAERRTDGS